jgi:hypothetical protein
LRSALRFLAAEPAIAATLGFAAPVGEPAIAAARRALVGDLAGRLEAGSASSALPEGSEVAIAEAALSLVSDRVTAGEAEKLPELAPELRDLIQALVGVG